MGALESASLALLMLMGVAAAAIWGGLAVHAYVRRRPKAQRDGPWYLAAILYLAIPAQMTVNTLESQTAASGISRLGDAIVLAIIALSALSVGIAFLHPRRRSTGLLLAVGGFYLALMLSAFLGSAGQSAPPVIYLTTPLFVFAFLANGTYEPAFLVRVTSNAVRVTLALSFAAVAVLPPEVAFNTFEARTFFGVERLAGITGHPNSLALLAVVGLLLEILRRSRWWWKALPVVALLFAQSTTMYVAAAVALILFFSSRSRVALAGIWVLAVAGAALMIIAPEYLGGLIDRALPDNASTFTGRARIWDAAQQATEGYPLFGWGPSLFDENFRASFGLSEVATHAFSQYLQSYAGQGIVGALSLAVLILAMVAYAIRGRQASRGA